MTFTVSNGESRLRANVDDLLSLKALFDTSNKLEGLASLLSERIPKGRPPRRKDLNMAFNRPPVDSRSNAVPLCSARDAEFPPPTIQRKVSMSLTYGVHLEALASIGLNAFPSLVVAIT